MTVYRKDHREFEVNFSAFHSTFPVETPLCSAKDFHMFEDRKALVEKSSALQLVSRCINLDKDLLFALFQMNNLTNSVSSVLNLAHQMAEENQEENLDLSLM